MTRGVAILGSTGSIGCTALRVLSRQRERFHVSALTAHSNAALLGTQAAEWSPRFVGLVSPGGAGNAGMGNGGATAAAASWRTGPDALIDAAVADDVSIVLNAVVGVAGMDATLAALRAGKRVALANKETLVVAGHLAAAAGRAGGGEIVPVDSEHSAILQCLGARAGADVRRLIITASGGPFREWTRDRMAAATRDQALRHPTWSMGSKITVDSATLVNKALEVIEAHYLFDLPYDKIEVVVHPQSIVHSMVEFVDGSVIAQVGVPSMELPILYALTHPERVPDAGIPRFDPLTAPALTFEAVRMDAFPALRLGIEAGRTGGVAPAVFNAANEAAVALFLDGDIPFGGIATAIERALETVHGSSDPDRDALMDADRQARAVVGGMW